MILFKLTWGGFMEMLRCVSVFYLCSMLMYFVCTVTLYWGCWIPSSTINVSSGTDNGTNGTLNSGCLFLFYFFIFIDLFVYHSNHRYMYLFFLYFMMKSLMERSQTSSVEKQVICHPQVQRGPGHMETDRCKANDRFGSSMQNSLPGPPRINSLLCVRWWM